MRTLEDYNGIEIAGMKHTLTKKGDLVLQRGKKQASVRPINGGFRIKIPGTKALYATEGISTRGAVRRARQGLHRA